MSRSSHFFFFCIMPFTACAYRVKNPSGSLRVKSLCPQIPRQLYTTRSERLVSEMVDFHHCIPHEVSTAAAFGPGSALQVDAFAFLSSLHRTMGLLTFALIVFAFSFTTRAKVKAAKVWLNLNQIDFYFSAKQSRTARYPPQWISPRLCLARKIILPLEFEIESETLIELSKGNLHFQKLDRSSYSSLPLSSPLPSDVAAAEWIQGVLRVEASRRWTRRRDGCVTTPGFNVLWMFLFIVIVSG